jgi:hypothetical protein
MEKENWQMLLRKAKAHVGLLTNDDDDDERINQLSYD